MQHAAGFLPLHNPTLLIYKKTNATAAFVSTIIGGSNTIVLSTIETELLYGLALNVFGIIAAIVIYMIIADISNVSNA